MVRGEVADVRVGIDLDGVLFDFAASVRRYLESEGSQGFANIPPGEPEHWHFYEDWGLSLDDFIGICHDGVDAGFVFSGPARPLAAESVRLIKDEGHEVHVITDRQFGSTPEASHRATVQWLDQHGIPYDSLTFSADKTCVETHMFIEDKLENYSALCKSGVSAYLVNRPWNMPKKASQYRVDSIAEFAWIVTGKWPIRG